MDDKSRFFLVNILQTIFKLVVWMLVCVYLGIYKNFAFFETSPDWKNILFYIFFVSTAIFLALHLIRKWKEGEEMFK
jgi:hypothetical protein